MRIAPLFPVVLVAMALPGLASAQSSDEEILRRDGGTELPPAKHEDDDLDEQVFYNGFGVSRVDAGFANLDQAINLDLVLGFRIPTVKWVGLEIDIGQTIIPGENQSNSGSGPPICTSDPIPIIDPDGTPNGCIPAGGGGGGDPNTRDPDEFQMQALGLSLAFKSTGRFYVMGRYGYRYLATSITELNDERSSTGFGAGVGYRWGKGLSGVELSYKELSENVDQVGLTFYARLNRR